MFEAYKIGIRIGVINQASAGLWLLAGDFRKAHAEAAALQARVVGVGRLLASGAWMAGAGLGLLASLRKPMEAAVQYENALNRFRQLNLGEAVDRDADHLARHAGVFGVHAGQMMDTVRDLSAVFGSYREAQRLAPELAALNAANAGLYGAGRGVDEKSALALMRVIDRRGGGRDAGSFAHTLDIVQRMMNATGGVVDAQALAQFSQYGGTAFRALSDRGLLEMTGLLTEQGGARAGTALMSSFQSLVAGRGSLKAKAALAELGLATLTEKVAGHVGGRALRTVQLDHIAGEDELRSSPVGWIRDVLLPQLRRRGLIDGQDAERDSGVILGVINEIASNRLASSQLGIIATQLPQILRDADLAVNAKDAAATVADYQRSAQGQFDQLRANLTDLAIAIGENLLPVLNPLIAAVTGWVRSLKDSPGLLRAVTLGVVGLGAALTFGGSVNLLAGSLRGLGSVLPGVVSAIGAEGVAGTLLGSLGLLGLGVAAIAATVAGAAYAIKQADAATDVDPWEHPGQRFVHRRGEGPAHGHWAVDPSLSQAHAGEHFVRLGRGGYWAKAVPAGAVLPAIQPAPPKDRHDHAGEHYVPGGRGGAGQWVRDAPAVQVVATAAQVVAKPVAAASQPSDAQWNALLDRLTALVQRPVELKVDGRTLAQTVTKELGREFGKASASGSGVDPRHHALPIPTEIPF